MVRQVSISPFQESVMHTNLTDEQKERLGLLADKFRNAQQALIEADTKADIDEKAAEAANLRFQQSATTREDAANIAKVVYNELGEFFDELFPRA